MTSPTTVLELADGARISTTTHLAPGQEPMVLLHGGPGLWDYLEPVAALFAGRFSTIRYHQRGCGASSAALDPARDFTMARYVADLDELRVQLGVDRWSVFGHSFGAALGLAYTLEHPDRVASLVGCNGVGLHWSRHKARFHEAVRARRTPRQQQRLEQLQSLERDWDQEVELRTLSWLPDQPDPTRPPPGLRGLAESPYPTNLGCNQALNAETSATEEAVAAAVGRVTCPVLLVHGELDPRPVDGVRELADALPDARLVVLPGAGHEPWFTHAEELGGAVLDFTG